MKRPVVLATLASLAACTPKDSPEECKPMAPVAAEPIAAGTALALTTGFDFQTSGLDALATDSPEAVTQNLLVASGDAALRKVGRQAVIVNRGMTSNLQWVNRDLSAGPQVALDTCAPHDVLAWGEDQFLVTCYDTAAMRIVGADSCRTIDLSALADADGIPEMDQMLRLNGRIYVTLQLLSRPDFYAPTGNSRVAVLDADTLELIDVDPETPGVQAYELACQNPFSALSVGADGRLLVGCSGNWQIPGTGGLAALDLTTGESTLVADETTLGGKPRYVRVDSQGVPYAVVSISVPNDPDFKVLEMRLVRLVGGTATTLYTSAGFSLSGFAFVSDGLVLMANRSSEENGPAGLWLIHTDTLVAEGPFETGQPPLEIEIF